MTLSRSALAPAMALSLSIAGPLSPAPALAQAPTRNIYSFFRSPGVAHGGPQRSDLAADADGDLYGTTPDGGLTAVCKFGCGTVYRLVPPPAEGQAWTEQTLANLDTKTGTFPYGAPVLDPAGNIYGTSLFGGPRPEGGGGTVWKLSPPASVGGPWGLKVIYAFSNVGHGGINSDGAGPATGLAIDSFGTLYGVTDSGGSAGDGVAFSLTPPAAVGGAWTETVLHTFTGTNDAKDPGEPLTVSADGRTITGAASWWYGPAGTPEGGGAIYRLRRTGAVWTYTRLYLLRKGDTGIFPNGPLVVDPSDNIFGTAERGGSQRAGTIFELSPPAAGQTEWRAQVLHAFDGLDGFRPKRGLTAGRSPGTLFGTTALGGAGGAADGSNGSKGVVFRLNAPTASGGAWTYTALHAFGIATQSTGTAGEIQNGVAFGKNDFLFGIANVAGPRGHQGRVFAQSPH